MRTRLHDLAGTPREWIEQFPSPDEVAPFILREDRVFAFQDLMAKGNPFRPVISGAVERHRVSDWIEDPDRSRWFVDLLNRSLNKMTGRLGLDLD